MSRPRSQKSLVSFNAGELSPKMDVRADVEKYQAGCRQMQNFWPLTHGGATRRRGLKFIAAAKYDDADKPVRMVRFQFSHTDRLMLELGDLYLRFFLQDGTRVMDGGDPYEVASPYTAAEAFAVQFAQFEDTLYLAHPLHPPHVLTRLADDNWTLAPVDFITPPLLDLNVSVITLTPSATTGTGITLTASAALFHPEQVGAYFQIGYQRDAGYVDLALTGNATGSSMSVLGGWTINTYGTWSAELLVQMSGDGGTTWTTVRKYKSDLDTNIADNGTQADTTALYRLKVENYSSSSGSPAPRAEFRADNAVVNGLVKITAVSFDTIATADVVRDLFATDATTRWTESAWSDFRGWPTAVCFFQQRLWFGGSADRPQNFQGSKTDDFRDFDKGLSTATDAMDFQISSAERNQILWMVGQKKLVIGTSGGCVAAYGDELEAAITATKPPLVLQQNSYACAYQRALLINNAILFVTQSGRKLREMVFDGGQGIFTADDLTVLADHITAGGMVTPAAQGDRDAIFWAVTGFGALIGLTYEKGQNVIAWHRHTTGVDDVFESVETLFNDGNDDDVWVSVRRDVAGTKKRFIEKFSGYYTPQADNRRVHLSALPGPQTAALPTASNDPGYQLCPAETTVAFTLPGSSTTTYAVPVRIAGVMAGGLFTGGTQAGSAGSDWYVGGGIDEGSYGEQPIVSFKLEISDPAQVFWLNTDSNINGVSAYDFENTISIKGGAIVSLTATPGTLAGLGTVVLANPDEISAMDVLGVTQPYQGEFVQVQIGAPTPAFPAASPVPVVLPDLLGEIFLDSAVTLVADSPTTTMSGLDHLEGATVDALADGNWVAGLTVSDGSITLPDTASIIHAGLSYDSILQPMRLDVDPVAGNTQGLVKRIHRLAFRLMDTGGLRLATTETDLAPVDVPLGAAITGGVLKTGDVEVDYAGDYDADATFVLKSKGPLPLTVLGAVVKYQVSET